MFSPPISSRQNDPDISHGVLARLSHDGMAVIALARTTAASGGSTVDHRI
ncbi:MAG: hypothetical protein H6875_07320 [Hyphomicrobiaceae bacterium]|nr:hypothetical protein [Hyphomicrobiaceae bacterium]